MGKGEIAQYKQRLVVQTHENQGLFGKELSVTQIMEFTERKGRKHFDG